MTLSEELHWRGFINQTTYPDLGYLDNNKITFYHGFDASADSQTVGNLAGMMLDRLFMRHGHKGVILAGGATSLIGDPGGKDSERQLQDEDTIAGNIEKAKQQLQKVFEGYQFKLVNNLDWTRDLKVIEYLREYGKHFSMTPLIQRDYIARRLGEGGEGISYAEFSYTVLQGIDYLHLFDNEGVTLQLGGSDQWGNCLSGVELIRRTRGQEVHVLTLPLIINRATGKKFGKTEDGAVWLDPQKTSVYQFYQFWLNVDDESASEYLKIFTELSRETIESVLQRFDDERAGRFAQKTLAFEVTKIVHGGERAEAARRVSEVLFGGGDYSQLQQTDMAMLSDELPVVSIAEGDVVSLLTASGLAVSNTEARSFINSGAVYLNGRQLAAGEGVVSAGENRHGYAVIRRGKNSHALIKFN